MKATAKFCLIYFVCFLVLAVGEELCFDPSSDTRMPYTIAGCVYYFSIGAIGWFIINAIVNYVHNIFNRMIASLLSGLMLLNILYYFVTDGGKGSNLILLAVNTNCVVSFFIAVIAAKKKLSGQ